MTKTLILTPIAERDVHYYLAAADELKKDPNLKVVFISFYQPGNDLIRQRGYMVFDPYEAQKHSSLQALSPQEIESRYQMASFHDLLLHEKLTFGLTSDAALTHKFRSLFAASELLLSQIESQFPSERKVVIQELAGFLGPLALFYTSMHRGWTNYFLEPSFFKGRIHFVRNDLFLKIPSDSPSPDSVAQVNSYLEMAMKNKVVVAAKKDAHHYRDMGLGKVFNTRNFQKLFQKIFYKYVKSEKQEFEHIWNHIRRNLGMLINRYRNNSSYTKLADLDNQTTYFYFPFHVQLDFALTIRCPQWLDQLGLIEKALENLPAGSVLLAKEHPASIGCLDQKRLEKLLKHPQFRLMHPQINSHDIVAKCLAIVTINSKVAAEALTKGMPVVSFGKAFYTQQGYTNEFTSWTQFQSLLQSWKDQPPVLKTSPLWIEFLERVWQDSFENELYDLNSQNVRKFAQAVEKKLAD